MLSFRSYTPRSSTVGNRRTINIIEFDEIPRTPSGMRSNRAAFSLRTPRVLWCCYAHLKLIFEPEFETKIKHFKAESVEDENDRAILSNLIEDA